MNIQEYISSGILESYVLGGLSQAESLEVEDMIKKYPEVKKEISLLEEDLYKYAQSIAVEPSSAAKDRLLNAIDDNTQNSVTIPMYTSYYKYAIAASLTSLIISLSAAVYFWGKWQDAENKVLALEQQGSKLVQEFNFTKNNLTKANDYLSLVGDTNTAFISLKGLEISPSSGAKVLWNKNTGEVFIDVKSLPAAPEGMQYQLWALADGKPVDAGVFETTGLYQLQKVKSIDNAQAFAVTLEKRGGSPVPNLSALYLLGNV